MKKCPHKRSPEKGFLKILGILGFTKISFEGSPNQATAPRQNDQKTKNWRRPDFLNLSATPKWHKTSQIGRFFMSNIFQQSTLSKVATMWYKKGKRQHCPRTFHCKSEPGFPQFPKVINDRQPQSWWGNWYVDMLGVPSN